MRAMRLILIMGACVMALSDAARTAEIHEAARTGDCARLREIVDRSPELVNARDDGGDVPLHFAAMMGRTCAVALLLQKGAPPDARNSLDQSPLLYAAYNGYAEIVDTLIAHGARFDDRDARGNTPIRFAARQGQLDVVELLVAKGARFDERGNQGKTPLYLAAAKGHTAIVKLLGSRGAKLDTRDDEGRTPFSAALSEGRVETAELLLGAGCAIEGDATTLGRYLNRAAAAGGERLIDGLIAKGASPDAIDERGKTLLHNAAIGGLTGLAGRLAARTKNIDAPDTRGKTALHDAVAAGHDDIAALLLEHGADPNRADRDGRTPLHVAEDAGRGDAALLLRQMGAKDIDRMVYRLDPATEATARVARRGEDAPLEITYIGNEGFLLARGEKKAMIDVLFRIPGSAVPSIDDRVFGMVLDDRSPFDGIDVCVASHVHTDHFSPRMAVELLKRSKSTVFASGPRACDSLRAAAREDFGTIAGRVVTVDPAWKKIDTLRLNGIDAEFFGVNHAPVGEEPFKTLATVLDFDGIRIVHLADEIVRTNVENFDALDLASERIDIAFADQMFLSDSVGQYVLRERIKPRYIVLMHAAPDELDADERDLLPLHPNLVIFRDPLEKKLFAH